jgi:dTDP-4-amino-4,6-dideoxygalactose transaminase
MMIPLAEPKISSKDIEFVSKQIGSTFIGPGKANEEFGEKIAAHSGRKFAILGLSNKDRLVIARSI